MSRDSLPPVPWHALAPSEVEDRLASPPTGLHEAEAAARLERFGENRLPEPRPPSALWRFLRQFQDVLIYVLLASAALALALGHLLDSAVILGVVLINAVVGFLREGKAERAIAAVGRLLAPRARVLRGGRWREVPAAALVPGDRVRLAPGDRVPADLRLITAEDLQIDESILTGESLPVGKTTAAQPEGAPLAERRSMAYSGTLVAGGEGLGLVVATGPATEIGRISGMLREVRRVETPLTRQLARFGLLLSQIILAAAALLLPLGVFLAGLPLAEAALAAVAFAVAAIPEGLPAILTIVLAVGVERMARRHALVRRLPAVETLGRVSLILTDKTGTLTENRLAVTHLAIAGTAGPLQRWRGDPSFRALLPVLAEALGEDHERDPLERALAALLAEEEIGLNAPSPVQARLPFSSAWKMSAVVRGGWLIAKGAPEALLSRLRAADGEGIRRWQEALSALLAEGLRVIALARRPAEGESGMLPLEAVRDLELLALIGFSDPPRPEVPAAIARCREAGIAVRIVTGDHALTAAAIARQIGLSDHPKTIAAAELAALDGRALAEKLRECEVFARATPEDKLRLVEAAQALGHCVAMTGDGVNDAPALKRADIGVAMGRRGAEAAREAAEIVLADDHFATIVAGIEEGRGVEDNIRKSLAFVLPTNAAQAAVVAVAILFAFTLPLSPVQILWVNMVTTVTLALALAVEPLEGDVMRRRLERRRGLITPFMRARILWVGVLLTLLTVAGFLGAEAAGLPLQEARTLALNLLVFGEIGYLFAVRRWLEPGFLPAHLLANRAALSATGLLILLQLLVSETEPFQRLLGTASIGLFGWLLALAAAIAIFALVEIEKWALRSVRGRRRLP